MFLGFGVLLVSSCSFLVSFCSFLLLGSLGGFPGVCGFFLSLVVFLCLFFLVPFFSSCFFFFLVLLVPFFFLSCFFLFLLVPFVLVLGGLGGFPGVWGFSCSFLVCSSCSISSCLGGLGGFPGVWGFLLFLSCFFLFHFFLFWGPGWFSWGLGVLLVLFLFLLLEEEEDEEKETRQDLWFGGYSCYFLVSFRRR